MKKQLPFGLVLEGSSTRSAVLRLPRLAEELGPIKSGHVGIARRFSNLIQGGYPVSEYEELQNTRVILLHIPDEAVNRIVDELCRSELIMNRISFVLCESWLTTDALGPLRKRGASVATLVRAPTIERDWFVLEGQTPASRLARRLIERHEARAFEMKLGSKHLLFMAEMLVTVLPIPLLTAAQRSLRTGGITGNDLAALLDHMTQKMLRDVIKGVRIPFSSRPPECSPEQTTLFLEALQETQPALASFLECTQQLSAKLICETWKNAIDGD